MLGFWVQRIGVTVESPVTQMLHPMHSRMSSHRPSSIFLGRNGSAIDGRAAPIRSSTPSRTIRTIVSAEVNRPTPTTGFVVRAFRPRTYFSCAPSAANREVIESKSHSPTMKSHTSGSSPTRPSTASISPRSIPRSPSCSSTQIRQATAARPSTSSTVSSRISRRSRALFSMLPPYSSLRSL